MLCNTKITTQHETESNKNKVKEWFEMSKKKTLDIVQYSIYFKRVIFLMFFWYNILWHFFCDIYSSSSYILHTLVCLDNNSSRHTLITTIIIWVIHRSFHFTYKRSLKFLLSTKKSEKNLNKLQIKIKMKCVCTWWEVVVWYMMGAQ